VYLEMQKRLAEHLRHALKAKYDLTIENIPVEIPPELKFGELATPIALQLARTLRKAPKMIAQEIVAELGAVEGFAGFEVAGAGYINARMDRTAGVRTIAGAEGAVGRTAGAHVLVEHTSINPNKAAHIGHLRNAILGDSFVRLLRAAGHKVDVQNYIDNTGVQVADVVVGFLYLEKKSLADVRALVAECETRAAGAVGHTAGVDYYCWDLYARTSQWYTEGSEEENSERKKLRYQTLHQIEQGGNETAELAELISTAVLRRHLETMLRLDIEYDFLPRESEILHLKFWEVAFEQLKQKGVLYFENEGKNKGCWVMRRPGAEIAEGELDEDAKVIVRSNNTVTYVGKDIAYHLWKFGLLGRDFGYQPFFRYRNHECWISAEHGQAQHPDFGGATAISGADADKGNAIAVLGVHIGLDLEDEAGEFGLVRLHFAADGGARQGGRRDVDDGIQQRLHTEVVHGRPKKDRCLGAIEIGVLVECIRGATHQIDIVAQLFGLVTDEGVQARIVEALDQLCRPFLGTGIEHGDRIVIKVIDAAETLAHADRPGHGGGADAQHRFNLVEQVDRLAAFTVEFIDKGDDRRIAQPADVQQLDGLRFDAVDRVDDHQGRVHGRQGAVGIFGKVLVPGGVEQVDHAVAVGELHDARRHRDATLFFQLHPVTCCVAVGLARAHGAGHLDGLAKPQQFLGNGGLAGVRVGNDRKGAAAGDLFLVISHLVRIQSKNWVTSYYTASGRQDKPVATTGCWGIAPQPGGPRLGAD
jgi:hypothetical protein